MVLRFQDRTVHVAKKIPSKDSPPPLVLPERYPLLGGIDGAIRTMALEMLVALGEADFSFD